MTSEYNKLLFTSENTEPELIDYYLSNDNKAHPFIKYLPKNAISQDIINTPIYQEIHIGYNPKEKSVTNLNVSNNNKNINEFKTKSEIVNLDSPDIIDCEVTMEDDYDSNKNNLNNLGDYKFYSKSPKCHKNFTATYDFNDYDEDISLYTINEKQNKARSPKILRKNNFRLDNYNDIDDIFTYNDNINNENVIKYNDFNYNDNDFTYKSNSLSKFFTKNPSPNQSTLIRNRNQKLLKDSYSTNNIHPNNNFQYHYNIGSYQNKNIYKKQMSISPKNKQYQLLSNSINKKNINDYGNNYSSSTKYSRSPILSKNNYSTKLLSDSITGFINNSNINKNNNKSNLNYLNPNPNINIDNCEYLIDNPVPNTFTSLLNIPEKNNNNNMYTNSEFNYILKKGQTNNKYNNNLVLTPSKIYKPKFPKSNFISNPFMQKYALNHFPQQTNNNNNIISLNNNPYSNSPKIVYQYNFQKSLSPKNTQYKSGNISNIITSNSLNSKKIRKNNRNKNIINSNKYTPYIKSSLPKISNFSQNVSKKEFLSNNINDISFGDSNDIENNLKNNNNRYGISAHENSLFSSKNSKKKEKNPKLKFKNQNEITKNQKNPSKKIAINSYNKYMFENINKIRTNPKCFIQPLKDAINHIAYDNKKGLYYNGNLKVALCKGKVAFEEAISFLEKAKPMKPLIYKKNLCVEISEMKKDFESGDYLRKKINDMVMKGISVRAFWRDIIKDPEINFLLMIIDDNYIRRGAKRKDILNPDMKYIGINSGSLGNNFVCYTVLSDE